MRIFLISVLGILVTNIAFGATEPKSGVCDSQSFQCLNSANNFMIGTIGPVPTYWDSGQLGCAALPSGFTNGCNFITSLCNMDYQQQCMLFNNNVPKCIAGNATGHNPFILGCHSVNVSASHANPNHQ